MRPLLPPWALLLLAVAAGGCTVGREYVGDPLGKEQLQRLGTLRTKADVLSELGPPEDMGLRLQGSLFVYRFRQEALDDLTLSFFQFSFVYQTVDRRTDRLIVLFDKKGNVDGYGLDVCTR